MNLLSYPVREQIRISEFFSMFEAERDQSYVFPGEAHNFWECVYVREGAICVSADERVYNMGSGAMIFHKPNELHKYHTIGSSNAKVFIFSYSAEGELNDYFRDKVFYLSQMQQRMIDDLIKFMRDETERLNTNKSNEPIDMYLLPFEKSPMYAQYAVTQIYMLFFSLVCDSKTIEVSRSHDSEIFGEAVSFMKNKIYYNPSVDEIARCVGISREGLKRLFKKYTGLGVHKYFLKLKLKYAVDMLENGMSVTETAEILGFSSQGYFTKAYKRETGTLPSERRSNQS